MTHSDPGIQTPSNDNLERTKRAQLEQSARNGSRYFFWIAFFSIFNQVMDQLSSERRFIFGLGTPQYIDRLLEGSNPTLTGASSSPCQSSSYFLAFSLAAGTFRFTSLASFFTWWICVFDSLRRYGWHLGPRHLHSSDGDGPDCNHETQEPSPA